MKPLTRSDAAIAFVRKLRALGRHIPNYNLEARQEFNVGHCRNLGKINYPRVKAEKVPQRKLGRSPYRRRA